jgi:type IV pilus assembly protein PilB
MSTTERAKAAGRGATSARERPVVPLGEALVRAGVIQPEQLETALQKQSALGLRLGETLVQLGFVSEEVVLPYIEQQLRVPVVRLREGLVDPAVVKLIPRACAEKLHALALFKVRGLLTVAMSEPQNLQYIDELERFTGLRIRPVFAFRWLIDRMIQRAYEEGFQVDAVTADFDETAIEFQSDALEFDLNSVAVLSDESPVVNLVNFLIITAVRQGASDIHIEPTRRHSIVRFRVDGLLREVLRPRRDIHPAIVSRIKVMGKMDIAEHRLPQDGRVHVVVDGREVDLRISTLPTVLGEKVVIRILDRQRVTFNLDQLGFAPDQLETVKQMLACPYGLILVTGPTGSGKTTTLYSALELLKSVHRNIVTVEDPVEYQIELVNQVQVNEATRLSFVHALRAILRQDPDVIMVGEIRDGETGRVAVQGAMTGHLVLSTLHTNDSASAVTRLVDMGVEPFKLAAALIGVIAQRLLRLICRHCKTVYYPPAELLQRVGYRGDQRHPFARGLGCERCHDTGFQGRKAIYEVFRVDEEVRRAISVSPDVQTLRQLFRHKGGKPLFVQALRLAEEGLTSLDEAIRVAFLEEAVST